MPTCECIEKIELSDIIVENATAPCGGTGTVLLDSIDTSCCEDVPVEMSLLFYNTSFFDSVILAGTDVDYVTSPEGQIVSGTIGVKVKCGCREGVQKIHIKLEDLCAGVCTSDSCPDVNQYCVCDPCTGVATCVSNGLQPNIEIIK